MATSAPADTEIASRLRLVIGRMARQLRQHGTGGLTLSQLSALATIEGHQPIRIGDLAVREGIAAPTATRVAASLEDAGLVSRRAVAADRRSAALSLTPRGRQMLSRLRQQKSAMLSRRLQRIPDDDLALLAAALPVLEALTRFED